MMKLRKRLSTRFDAGWQEQWHAAGWPARLRTLARLFFLLSLLTPAYYSGPLWQPGTENLYFGFQALFLLLLVSIAMLILPLNPSLFTDGWAVVYVALGVLGLVNCFGCLIFLPFRPFAHATRRLFVASALLTGAALITIVVLTMMAANSNDRLLLSPWLWLVAHALFCASLWPTGD